MVLLAPLALALALTRALARAIAAGRLGAVRRQAVLREVVEDAGVGRWVRVLQVQAVAGTRDDGNLEVLGVWNVVLGSAWDVGVASWCCKAVATAVWDVTLASDDVHRASELVHAAGLAAEAEQLANSDGLAGLVRGVEDRSVEHARSKEVCLDSRHVASGEVAVWQSGERSDAVRLDEVTAKQEQACKRAVLRESGQGDTVRDGRVHRSQSVGVLRPVRVANVDNLLEGAGDALDSARSQGDGKSTERVNFQESLDLGEWVAVRGLANSETVVCES